MMSIHEIQQLSSPAEAAASSTIEEGVSLCLLGHSEDGEQSQQEQNMDSLDLTDVFGIPPTSSSSGSGECQPSDDSTSSTSSSSSSSSSPSKSDESSSLWLPLHQDSRDLIRRRLEKEVHDNDASHSSSGFSQRMSSTLDESTVSSTDSSCGSDSDPDSEEHDDLHNDSRKLIQLKIKRRAMCSNARTQDINDEDSDDNLSFEALHNDSLCMHLGLLKNLVSRANINCSGGIFHRFTSASNPTSGLHNDSLLGEKTRTTIHGDKRTMIGASIDQLDGDHNDSDAGDHAQNNGSSSFILDALHSHDSLRELVGDPPDAILSGTSLVTTCTFNVTACKSPTSTCCCQER